MLSDKSAARRAQWQQTTRSIADGLREPAGTFLSRDAVKSLHAESDIIAQTKSGGLTLYELRAPEEPRRRLITIDADKLKAVVSKVLDEKGPVGPQPPDEPEKRYLEVDTERRIPKDTTVKINVRIAAVAPAAGPVELVKMLIPSAGLAVTVVIDVGDGLTPLDATAGMLTVLRGADTPWLLFRFKPLRNGAHPINIRLFTGGALTATMDFEIFVEQEQPVSAEPLRTKVQLRDRGADEVSLTIRFDEHTSRYHYRWIDRFYSLPPERASKELTASPSDLVKNVVQQLNEIAQHRVEYEPRMLREFLQTRGTDLWDQLIPEDMQRDYWDRRTDARKLTLHTAGPDPMLWELLYPYGLTDDGFLIEQLLVTRWADGPAPSAELSAARSLIVVPGTGALQNARSEAAAVEALLSAQGKVEVVDTLAAFVDQLDNKPDLIHFACHNSFTAAGSSIRFPDGVLDPPFLRKRRLPRAMIFINACRSDGIAETYTGLTSWAAEFVRIGAAAFVGSLWEVRDDSAPTFATTFYEQMLQRRAISDAMRAAREATKQYNDPTWLAYTLYADPTAVLT